MCKTTCARIFAKTINCLNPQNGHDACNECESCKAFNEQRSFNIHELDAASNNSVDDIRSLIDQVRIPPQIGKYSVYIIDEVHMLSSGAFNALLKTLEEPPSYAIFILATTEKHKVPATILSRCQVYDFQRITMQDTVDYLQKVAAQEGVTVDQESLNVVAQKADGGMRDALSIFDQLVAFSDKKITYEQTLAVLNVLDSDYYFRLVDMALKGDVTGSMLLLNDVLSRGFDAGHFIIGLEQHLRDVLVSKDPQTLVLLEASDAIRKRYAEQAQHCSPIWIFRALDVLNTCDINYRTARNKRLMVEIGLVKLCGLVMPAQQPAQQPVPAQPSQPSKVQPSAPKPEAPKAAPKIPTVNLSFGKKPAATTPAAETPATPKEERNAPFTLDQLRDAWFGLKQSLADEPRLVQLVQLYKPNLVEPMVAEVQMPNPWQLEEMKKALPRLVKQIQDQLQNDHLQIRAVQAEYNAEQMAFTAEEQYKLMTEANPLLNTLKEKLDLVID